MLQLVLLLLLEPAPTRGRKALGCIGSDELLSASGILEDPQMDELDIDWARSSASPRSPSSPFRVSKCASALDRRHRQVTLNGVRV